MLFKIFKMKMPEKPTKSPSWITPFKKQCFVTMGMSLNMAQMGLVMGYSSVLVPQLELPESAIPIDDDNGSWIAAIPAISVMIGNLTVPFIMGTLGRKVANLTTLVLSAVGWICIVLSTNILMLLAARFLQGIAMGMTATLGPLLIGEYTSPVNRGAFLMTISLTIGIGVLAIHSMGSYLLWQTVALICIAIIIIDLAMVIMSPESPSWLADQGRYEESKVVFRWLRGDGEEDELTQLIEASTALRRIKDEEESRPVETLAIRIKNNLRYFGQTVRKNEFIKPIIIMIHIYALAHWTGVNILASYAVIFINTAIGGDVDIPNIMLSLDINRSIFNIVALIVIKKIKRRTVLLTTVSLNILALVIVAGYTFAKANGLITFDPYYRFWVGIVLIHFLTFTIAIGALPMSFVLGGELFPLQYKSLAGGVSCVSFSLHLFATIKTVPAMLSSVNIYGVYLVYCCILVYSLIVVGIMLPETKDKTLQEIENEFRGHKKQLVEEECESVP